MAVDAEDLLIRPFRDVVAVGSAAVTNASTHATHDNADRMSRAAQAIVREGERALNKVQVVWNDQSSKYGDSFRDMMVQQGVSMLSTKHSPSALPTDCLFSLHREAKTAAGRSAVGLR
jgi:hypothetical protein